jgi:hypothetical protein
VLLNRDRAKLMNSLSGQLSQCSVLPLSLNSRRLTKMNNRLPPSGIDNASYSGNNIIDLSASHQYGLYASPMSEDFQCSLQRSRIGCHNRLVQKSRAENCAPTSWLWAIIRKPPIIKVWDCHNDRMVDEYGRPRSTYICEDFFNSCDK